MAEKHLHELLREEQEPFILKNYINERRNQLKSTVPITHLQPKRRKPISQNPNFSSNFRKNPCFFSFFDSDPRKSPLFDFHSPPKTPCRNSNTLFVNIPSRTAAMLLESALRIQKQPSSSSKPKNPGFGFFGSALKRIALGKRIQKREICGKENPVSLKDILKWDSFHGVREFAEERAEKAPEAFSEINVIPDVGFSCTCEMSDWLMGLEEKSEHLESSRSSSRSGLENFEDMGVREDRDGESRSCEVGFCSSPFRFRGVEDRPDSGFRTPEFGSPAESPGRRKTEVVGSQLFAGLPGNADDKKEYEAEEEKEQLSPVSVLDAPFEDIHEEEEEEEEEEDDGCFHGFEHSLATVHRAKQQLLNKIRRFERLAALDPLELEKSFEEEEEEEDVDDDDDDDDEREVESLVALEHEKTEEFVKKVLTPLEGNTLRQQIPSNTKRLVLDLADEERGERTLGREPLVKRLCKKIESWKNVESNTIDMTVELDFRRECDEWLRCSKEVQEMATQFEFVIFGSLVDELLSDLAWWRDYSICSLV